MNISTKKTVFLILLFTFWIYPIPSAFSNSFKESSALNGTKIKLSSSEEESLQEDKYIIGPGDVLGLEILDLPELSGKINVLNDGTSSIPIIGSVYLNNLTLRGATEKIRSLLSKELIRPDLRISVLKARPLRISIVGEVERPGLYTFDSNVSQNTENDTLENHTLIDAIIKSGGITTRSNLKEVILKRRLPGNDMNYKVAKLDLFSLIREGNQSQNPHLFDGDVIVLKEVKEKNKGSFDKTLGNLYPEEIDVYIVGEVTKPGLNTVLSNSTLSQAILAAGGTKFSRANTSNIELIRLNNNGSASLRKFSYKPGLGASEENNPILLNGDVIRVRRNNYSKITDPLSTITSPVRDAISIYTLINLLD